jgi:hypothetical protein
MINNFHLTFLSVGAGRYHWREEEEMDGKIHEAESRQREAIGE